MHSTPCALLLTHTTMQTEKDILMALSPARIWENMCVQRAQKYLDTGEHDTAHSLSWDILCWLDAIELHEACGYRHLPDHCPHA